MNKNRLFALVTSAIMMVTFCTNSTNVIRLNATPQTDANANSQQTNQAQQQEEDLIKMHFFLKRKTNLKIDHVTESQ